MYRVYCNNLDGIVEQIFDLSEANDLNEFSFSGFFMIDTEQEIDYSFVYDREAQCFLKNENYVEPNVFIEPNQLEVLQDELNRLQMMSLPANNEVEVLRQENEELKERLRLIEEKLGL